MTLPQLDHLATGTVWSKVAGLTTKAAPVPSKGPLKAVLISNWTDTGAEVRMGAVGASATAASVLGLGPGDHIILIVSGIKEFTVTGTAADGNIIIAPLASS